MLREHFQVMLVDFPDGYMRKNIHDPEVQWINFDSVEYYPDQSLVILQLLPPWNIPDLSKFPKGTRFLFWGLHPNNLFPYFIDNTKPGKLRAIAAILLRPMAILRQIKLKRFIVSLAKKKSIIYMDGENHKANINFFGRLSMGPLVPVLVPALVPRRLTIACKKSEELIRIVWVGRLVDFKVNILIHLMMRLAELNLAKYKISLDVLGTGDAALSVENAAKTMPYQVRLIGEVDSESISSFLMEKADLVVAMGQSAVEAAGLGIPTLLVDFSKKPIKGFYRFKWIYDRVNYSVGEEISAEHFEKISSFDLLIDDYLLSKVKIGSKCYDYWKKNHSEEIFLKNFLKHITKASFTIDDIYKMKLDKPDFISVLIRKFQDLLNNNLEEKIHQFKGL